MNGRAAMGSCALLMSAAAGAQPTATDFLRTHVPGSPVCIFWANRVLTYSVDAAGYSKVNVFPAIDAAYATWQAQAKTCSDFQYVKGPTVQGAQVGYDPNSSANYNAIVFREAACRDVVPANDPCVAANTCLNVYSCWSHDDQTIALTTTTFSPQTGVIYDADTEFNAAPHADLTPAFLFTVVDSPPCGAVVSESCVATDVQETMTHEAGHAIGLDHVLVAGSTMEPTAPIGETQKRIIDVGTGAGFCTIYPLGQPSPPCDPTAEQNRRVTATSKGTLGVSVLGCAAAGGGALVAAALVALALLLTKRGLNF